jgi:hypothetical protein
MAPFVAVMKVKFKFAKENLPDDDVLIDATTDSIPGGGRVRVAVESPSPSALRNPTRIAVKKLAPGALVFTERSLARTFKRQRVPPEPRSREFGLRRSLARTFERRSVPVFRATPVPLRHRASRTNLEPPGPAARTWKPPGWVCCFLRRLADAKGH